MIVVFCLPGRSFSGKFLAAWTNIIETCHQVGITPYLSTQYSSVVHFARALCLGADVSQGEHQKPFQGKIKYDYIFWIDSDILFTPSQVLALLESPHNITCGLYLMENMVQYAVVKDWDINYFKKNHSFQFITKTEIQTEHEDVKKLKDTPYMEVSYSGMGFMCIKQGVIEKLTYPWFYRPLERISVENGVEMVEMSSEDVCFCKNLQDAGEKIMIDKRIIVGHEKCIAI